MRRQFEWKKNHGQRLHERGDSVPEIRRGNCLRIYLEEIEAKNKPEAVMESPMLPAIKALTTGISLETTWSDSESSDDITETFSKDLIKREFCRISTIVTSNARTIPSQKADQLGYTKDEAV